MRSASIKCLPEDINNINQILKKGCGEMSIFNEKSKVLIIGDRDGIPGPAMEECIKTTPAEVVFSATECFV